MLNNQSVLYEQPDDINITLKEHQLAMLYKCLEIEKSNNIGIMRDKPGAGKTYVILALINELKKRNNNIDPNIIIVPQNIYYQWLISIENFSNNLSYDKFISYDSILDLYVNPDRLKEKDIILTTSSYYYTIASTFKSLKINVKRIFIDEIDSISNLINMDINANFIMFVSASFDINNNGFFTEKIKENNIDEITCICDESFINENIILEDPIKTEYICKSIFIDKILKDIISVEEMNNINAMEYKLNNKKFERCVAKDEKDFMNILINGNKNEIERDKSDKEDMINKIEFYKDIKSKKVDIFNNFKTNIDKIEIIKDYKKSILNLIDSFNENLNFFSNPIVNEEYEEIKDMLVKKRKNILKNVRNLLNDYVEILYNFNFNDLKDLNIEKLKNNFERLINLDDIINENINKIKKEYDKLDNKIENLEMYLEYYFNFKNYVSDFDKNIKNLKYYYDCDNQIKFNSFGIKKLDISIKNNEKKIDLIYDRFKENNLCPICYELFTDKIYVTINCCNNKICYKCVEKWHKTKNNCIYCNTDNIGINDLFLINKEKGEEKGEEKEVEKEYSVIDFKENGNETNNKLDKNIYNFDKLTFLRDFIRELDYKDQKVIIFSDYNNIFSKITDACKEFDVKYSDLDKGNIKEIEEEVVNYKYGESNILLANSSLFGCGMNLENSSHIIFVHKMNKKMENQVIGRAQRLGRKGKLNIIYLEYENEVAKEINEIQINNIETIENICNDIKNNEQVYDENLNYNDNFDNSFFELNNNLDMEDHESDFTNIEGINNFESLNDVNLPTYDEVIDINLDELISNLS